LEQQHEQGSQGGGTTTTVPGSLPITGADLLGRGIAAVGALGIGGASLVIARRRRNGEVSSPSPKEILCAAPLRRGAAHGHISAGMSGPGGAGESALSRDEFRMCGLGV
jgi:LPXTG-motif cell wall-anchored protein